MTSNKFFYYVVTLEEHGKFYNYPEKIHKSQNIASYIRNRQNILFFTACRTKKEAETMANTWNKSAIKHGEFMH